MATTTEGKPAASAAGAPEQAYGSTRWAYRRVKIAEGRTARGDSGPKGRRWRYLPGRRMRDGITLRVKYRGGAEAWVEVHGRGSMGRFPGWVPIYDVLKEVCNAGETLAIVEGRTTRR
jgi:hypothetical protein